MRNSEAGHWSRRYRCSLTTMGAWLLERFGIITSVRHILQMVGILENSGEVRLLPGDGPGVSFLGGTRVTESSQEASQSSGRYTIPPSSQEVNPGILGRLKALRAQRRCLDSLALRTHGSGHEDGQGGPRAEEVVAGIKNEVDDLGDVAGGCCSYKCTRQCDYIYDDDTRREYGLVECQDQCRSRYGHPGRHRCGMLHACYVKPALAAGVQVLVQETGRRSKRESALADWYRRRSLEWRDGQNRQACRTKDRPALLRDRDQKGDRARGSNDLGPPGLHLDRYVTRDRPGAGVDVPESTPVPGAGDGWSRFPIGSTVEYNSASYGGWFPAKVLAFDTAQELYILDCKGGVPAEKLRHARPQDDGNSEVVSNACGWKARDSFVAAMGVRAGDIEVETGADDAVSAAGRDDDATFNYLVEQEIREEAQEREATALRAGGVGTEGPFRSEFEGYVMPQESFRCRGECPWTIFYPALGTSAWCFRRCSRPERFIGGGCCDYGPCDCLHEHVLQRQPPLQVWRRWATYESALADWYRRGSLEADAGGAVGGPN
jgi:hypothetical protein